MMQTTIFDPLFDPPTDRPRPREPWTFYDRDKGERPIDQSVEQCRTCEAPLVIRERIRGFQWNLVYLITAADHDCPMKRRAND